MVVDAYVELGVNMAYDAGVAAWTFDLNLWGMCGQGLDEAAALDDLTSRIASVTPEAAGLVEVVVVETIGGDEQAFARDRVPCSDRERQRTTEILTDTRAQTIELVQKCSARELDNDDPDRTLPGFAHWRTLRQMAWHLADTESRYYLPAVGLPWRMPASDLLQELVESGDHVRRQLAKVPGHLVVEGGEVWTTVKLMRRLAWHERSELETMQVMLSRLRR